MRLGVKGNMSIFLLFLRGKHKMVVFSSNLKVAQRLAYSSTDKNPVPRTRR